MTASVAFGLPSETARPNRPGWADVVAGLSIAGLLLPEAVAYAGLAGLPPQSGVMALFAGLLVYGLVGSSRFAIVSSTSSSAAVLLAALTSVAIPGAPPGSRVVLAAGLVLLTGAFFLIAAAARLGSLSNLVAKPVLRGFALGLALTIVIKQCPKLLGVPATHDDVFRLTAGLFAQLPHWNWGGAALGGLALVLLHGLGRWRMLPAGLIVIALGIAADVAGLGRLWQVPAVGALDIAWASPRWPDVTRAEWLRLGQLALPLALILYAESYGSIRTFAIRHGDGIHANRDLIALGGANILSGLLQAMPVGAGYSATSANEGAGARSRAAGLMAGAVIALAVLTLLPWLAHIPEPVLAAIVIHAVAHTLDPSTIRPYFVWRRDRLVVMLAFAAVLVFGVLDGLLVAMAASIVMLLRRMASGRVDWLGRLGDSHDFVDTRRHPEAAVPAGILIARPDEGLFFGNAETVLTAVREKVQATADLRTLILSLEESPDLDATSLESLGDFAAWCHARGTGLQLARVKDGVRHLLGRFASPDLPPGRYAAWSVDDAVRLAQADAGSAAG